MDKKAIRKLRDLLEKGRDMVVTTHSNPDGDALGSSLAWAMFLRKLGKQVQVIVPDPYPDFLSWMPGNREIIVWEREEDRARSLITSADIVFCLDFNALHRLNAMGSTVSRAPNPKVLIDHHVQPSDEFSLMFSTIDVSSTAELVYDLIAALDGLDRLDPDIAVNLFVGIMTDTGSFSYACNRAQTFRTTADLISRGVDAEQVHRMVYDTYSEDRMRLLGFSLSERMKVFREYGAAYIYLTREDLEAFKFQIGDTEGLVNYPLSIKGIRLSVMFTEKEDHIRMSLRSKGDFSVNLFVREHFEGGGHRNAAGGNAYGPMDKILQKFEGLLPQYRDELFSE